MRCATSLIRNVFLSAFLFLAPVGLWAQPTPDGVSLSLPQARALAAQALDNGDTALAIRLARGLIEADRRDTGAWYVVAAAQMRQGNPRAARAAVTRAYRFARTPAEKLQSAQLAARFAVQENRPTMAQAWLRRAANHVDDPAQEKLLAADYKMLRRINPWSFSLRTEVRPSDNVNNGSSAVFSTADGVTIQSGLGQGLTTPALSGTVATVDLSVGYRLRANAASSTTLSGRLYEQRVRLSAEARALDPTAQNSDYSLSYTRIGLNHAFAVGSPDKRGSAAVDIGLADVDYGGRFLYRALQIGAERNWRLENGASLQLNAQYEKRIKTRRALEDSKIWELGAVYGTRLANGDTMMFALSLRDSKAGQPNGTSTSASLRATYSPAQQLGPVRINAALGLEYAEFPVFNLGQTNTSRREDTSWYGEVSLFFPDLDYAGFAPNLRLRHGQKSSNFSQFTSRETSISLGIQSKF